MATEKLPRRHRDPDRKQRILDAAASLGARRGFHALSMADIGAEAGIVGSGIYRHFDGKTAILVAMLEQVMDRLADRSAEIMAADITDAERLSELVRGHIEVALQDGDVLSVYYRESHTVPEVALRRLRRRHRLYIEEWVHLLAPRRPDLADAELRVAVHAGVGAIQSILNYQSGIADARAAELLETMAHACLGTTPASTVSEFSLTN
ncbi:TetR/AcrR family transcriptional regulator [Streptomyces sp. NPDC051218]|uniref:TetR/AcrR family transcriptional regulator n=1 Tax=Streptomyces sp. NPDC051218 TaxID=3365645 RepID=UPI00379D54AE